MIARAGPRSCEASGQSAVLASVPRFTSRGSATRRSRLSTPQSQSHSSIAAFQEGWAIFAALETRQITAYVSLGREGKPGATPNPALEATRRMAEQLVSERGRTRYRRRKAIVEPVFGWIKDVLGFRRFSLRGVVKARGEWNVVCLAVNLKRFHRIQMA